ncbi:MAG: molybdopterin biosynthesis protein [Deltaproteobacteria bacterium]|nr:molybdopterin biosynthesis protein [Deltaproteobacteria bacterium]
MEKRKVYLKLTPAEEALNLILTFPSPLTGEEVPLNEALGRVLAGPAEAVISSPAFHGAAMDGAAVRAENTFGASLKRPKTLAVGREAFWINTGRPLPPETNAVIMAENIVPGRDGTLETITIEEAAFPWQHVRKIGEDAAATEGLLPMGTVIGAYELGALAAAGIRRPLVFRKPSVVFIPTGSEMAPLENISPEELLAGQKLPEFNSLVIGALVKKAGGEVTVWPVTKDDPEELAAVLKKAAGSSFDLIIVNAGSSAGSRDYTAPVLEELGEVLVHGLKLMPGKPTVIGRLAGRPVLGLPGYPVSAAAAFELLGEPLLSRWQGRETVRRPRLKVRLFQDLASKLGLEEQIRVRLGQVDDSYIAVPLPRGAGTVTVLARADGIIRIPAEAEGFSGCAEAELLRPLETVRGALLAVGSHDNALALLDNFLRRQNPGWSLTSAHVGSLGGLTALSKGLAHLAGCHLLGPDGTYNLAAIEEHLPGTPVRLVHLAGREQGLMVMPGNPLNIRSLADLIRPEVTYINRQKGSGTRVLLDYLLACGGLDPDRIRGYEDEEYTHLSIAAAVAGGRASCGLGILASASALGLDFVPIAPEQYDLVILSRYFDDPRIQALLEIIRSSRFQEQVQKLGGYRLENTGRVLGTFPG